MSLADHEVSRLIRSASWHSQGTHKAVFLDSTKDLVNPFIDNEPEQIMAVDQHESIAGGDTDSMTPNSFPSSFLSGVGTLEQRTLATLSTPQTDFNPQLVEGERTTAAAKRRIFAGLPQYDDDDCISTPTKIPGSGSRPTFSRSGSLLARLYDKGTMLGKHPQTHSPGEEGGSRTKGFKCLASSGADENWKQTEGFGKVMTY